MPPPAMFARNVQLRHPLPDSLIPIIYRSGNSLLAYAASATGGLHSFSTDYGTTWSAVSIVNACNRKLALFLTPYGTPWYVSQEQRPDGGQYYLHIPDGEGWQTPVPLRDTDWGRGLGVGFAFDSTGRAYMILHDNRDGNSDVYFSFSADSGRTWSQDVRINDDASGQEQGEVMIASSPDGTVCIAWADNRNEKTLFDIYSALSTDGGKSWSHSMRVNDDTTATWQTAPSLIHDGETFCVAWMDYRLPASSGDIRSVVYFSRWDGEANRWSPNRRVNEIGEGNSSYPTLSAIGGDSLACLWMDPSRNILNDIRFAYSTNNGATWSPSITLNDDEAPAKHYHRGIGWLGRNGAGEHLFGWLDNRSGHNEVFAARWIAEGKPEAFKAHTATYSRTFPAVKPFAYRSGALLFTDDFTKDSGNWTIRSGVWVRRNAKLVGYGSVRPVILAGEREWRDYEFSGEFMLDDLDHRCASIFLRAGGTPLKAYRISNYFRAGIVLELLEGSRTTSLEQVIYPVRKSIRYTFRGVVKGNMLNYYLNDSLCLVSTKLDRIPQGGVGLGSQAVPAYFSNIAVRRIE